MAVGGNDAQNFGRAFVFGMNVQAVQIVAGFFGGNGKLSAVDYVFQLFSGNAEIDWQLVAGNDRKIFHSDGGKGKFRAAGGNAQLSFVVGEGNLHFRAVGQLADDVVKHVSRCGGGAGFNDFGVDDFGDFGVHVGGLKADAVAERLDSYVGKNRDGVSLLNNALHVVEGF